MRLTRKTKLTGREYFTVQADLLRWYVARGHSEMEYVIKLAKLFELHHKRKGVSKMKKFVIYLAVALTIFVGICTALSALKMVHDYVDQQTTQLKELGL